MLEYLPAGQPYDLVTAWRQALAAGERLAALVAAPFWQDLGTPATYLAAHRRLLQGEAPKLSRYFAKLTDPCLGVGDVIEAGAQFGGGVCLGDRVKIGAGAVLRQTVVWDEATVEPGVRLDGLHRGLRGAGAAAAPGERCWYKGGFTSFGFSFRLLKKEFTKILPALNCFFPACRDNFSIRRRFLHDHAYCFV